MPVLGNKCAAGMPNLIRLSPEQFRPRTGAAKQSTENAAWVMCHFCNQMTMVKQAEPRKGFFVEHDESQQGIKTQGKLGTPARVRGRRK